MEQYLKERLLATARELEDARIWLIGNCPNPVECYLNLKAAQRILLDVLDIKDEENEG